jgi:DNA-binding GntR family transcriptional regulator
VYTRSYPEIGLRADRAYTALKHRLLVGEFPLNTRLAEERLAAMLEVSRTPVREALHRLHSEGLVQRIPDGGYGPVAPDVSVMRDLYEVRRGLEVLALQRPARMGIRHDVVALEQLHGEWIALAEDTSIEAAPEFVLLDESFHVSLAAAAGNPPLVDVLRQVNDRIRLVRMQDFLTAERITETIDDHVAIVEAVLAGRLGDAEDRFSEHLEHSIAVVEERVSRAIARMISGGQP